MYIRYINQQTPKQYQTIRSRRLCDLPVLTMPGKGFFGHNPSGSRRKASPPRFSRPGGQSFFFADLCREAYLQLPKKTARNLGGAITHNLFTCVYPCLPNIWIFFGQLIYALNKFCGTFSAEDWCVLTVNWHWNIPDTELNRARCLNAAWDENRLGKSVGMWNFL